MLFAHLKRHLGLRRLRLRGLKGANEEFLLAATAQNLKRMVKMLPTRGAKPTPIRPVKNTAFARNLSGLERLTPTKNNI